MPGVGETENFFSMEDKYKDKRSEYWCTYRRKQLKLKLGIINPNIVDYYAVRVKMVTPKPDEGLAKSAVRNNIRDKASAIAELAQKEVRKEWAHRGNVNNIIIIEHGTVNQSTMYYQCEIHQLRMDIEKRKEFEKVCETIITNINNNLKEKQNEEMD